MECLHSWNGMICCHMSKYAGRNIYNMKQKQNQFSTPCIKNLISFLKNCSTCGRENFSDNHDRSSRDCIAQTKLHSL